MIYVGIDPGLTGAIAAIDANGFLVELHDTPILKIEVNKKKKNEYQISRMVEILRDLSKKDLSMVSLEKVHSMPKQGVVSSFSFGRGFGLWEGILSSLDMSYDLIQPQKWKKDMLYGMPKGKDSSRLRAQQLFPRAELHLKKHEGRAEALLMAEFLRRSITKE